MGRFSRLFPNIGQLFPPWGPAGIVVPSSIGDDVTLIHELYRADLKHTLYLTTTFLTVNGTGTITIAGAVPEPQPGYVAWVYSLAIRQAEATASRFATTSVEVTGNDPLLPTGAFGAANFNQLLVRAQTWTPIPVPMPIPRGNNVRVFFESMTAATDVQAVSHICQIPVQAFDWQRATAQLPHTVFNTPI